MLDATRIKQMVRWKEKDTDEVRFSDYEIWDAINEVLRYVANRLANMQSDVTEREKVCDDATVFADGVPLPDDFLSIKGLYRLSDGYRLHAVSDDHVTSGTFRLFGGKLYAEEPFRLQYYGTLGTAKDGWLISLPESFTDALVKLTRMVLNNTDVDTMTQAVMTEVEAIVPRRKYNGLRPKMPFFM